MTTFERVLVKMPAIFWLCPIFFRSSAERRQDLRAVHDLRGARSEKGPFVARSSRGASPNARLRGFSDARRDILPKPARFGCTAAICCRELALFPSEAPSGTHEAKKLPRIAARERTAAISCHCRTPGERISRAFCHRRAPEKAPRRNDATDRRPKTHHGEILPRPAPRERMASICCHGKVFRGYAAEICCRCLSGRHWRAAAMKEPGVPEGTIDPSAASGASALHSPMAHAPQCFREVGALRSLRGAVCVLAPSSQGHGGRLSALIAGAWGPWVDPGWRQPRGLSSQGRASLFSGLIARSGFESALFRWATMSPFRVLRSSAVSCAEAKCALTFMLGAANVVKGMSWAFARQWEIWQAR